MKMKRAFPTLAAAAALACGGYGCGKSKPAPAVTQAPPSQAAPKAGPPQQQIDDFVYKARYGNDPAAVEKMLAEGMDANVKDHGGMTALNGVLMPGASSSAENLAAIVDILLAHGADPKADNSAAFFSAVAAGRNEIAAKLLDKGADLNAQLGDGYTPLMAAIFNGQEATASFLLDRGADPNVKRPDGKNAWAMAFGIAYGAGKESSPLEELLRHRTIRYDIETILRNDASLKGYLDVDKWLREHP